MSKKCDECKRCTMNDDMTTVVMSSADWQRNEQRHLRREKRLIAIIILAIVLFVGSNVFWIWKDSQYEDAVANEETIIEGITQETEGGNNTVVGGDYVNGETNN